MRHFKIFCLLLLFACKLFPQTNAVERVDFSVKDKTIDIRYNLNGNPKVKYQVSVVLLRRDQPDFQLVPKKVMGDVGRGKFAGQNRSIKWDFSDELQLGANIADYYFQVTAKPVKNRTLLYGGIGSAIIVGTVVAILIGVEPEGKPIDLPPTRPN
ncbi:MAG: hypothetical protein COT43_12095 [Candidatus Marinimicrobia bacterium CG08_land_8_20_14_0_20_45_22]|nr:MAG: hypothetical protein COT43_12095 [Candidatus Marinimicrobia bacterium CG08_land_8_20_14_0_20_45_22]